MILNRNGHWWQLVIKEMQSVLWRLWPGLSRDEVETKHCNKNRLTYDCDPSEISTALKQVDACFWAVDISLGFIIPTFENVPVMLNNGGVLKLSPFPLTYLFIYLRIHLCRTYLKYWSSTRPLSLNGVYILRAKHMHGRSNDIEGPWSARAPPEKLVPVASNSWLRRR